MDKKGLIPIESENDIEENSVLVVKRKKKRKKLFLFKRLLCFIIIFGLCYLVYAKFDDIKLLTNNLIDKFTNEQNNENPPSSDLGGDNNLSSDNTEVPNEAVKIPNGAYEILKKTGSYTGINNETEINLDFDYSKEGYTLANDIYKQYGNEAPCVLIIHSSCLESYSNGSYYYTNDSFYTRQSNVALVGKMICDTLNDNNINAIHIDDIFANGSIFSSRAEFDKSLEEALKKYPSISYVLDISRDIIINDDLSMDKMIYDLNGKALAQIKLTVGSSTDESKSFWHKNINFATKLALENSDLIYDVTLADFELSQDIKPISIRVDIGAYSNSIDEALLAGRELALRLSEVLYQG